MSNKELTNSRNSSLLILFTGRTKDHEVKNERESSAQDGEDRY